MLYVVRVVCSSCCMLSVLYVVRASVVCSSQLYVVLMLFVGRSHQIYAAIYL